MKAREKISKAIINAMDSLPFYSELMMRSKIIPFPDKLKSQPNHSPTMAVGIDGNIYFDEDFVQKLSEQELLYVILHESLHKAYLHLHRINKRDALIWNIAADIFVDRECKYELIDNQGINARIVEGRIIADSSGVIELPMFNIRIENVHEKTVEQLYDELANNKEVQKAMKKRKGEKGEKGEGQGQSSLGKQIDEHSYTTEDGKSYDELTETEKEEYAERAKDDVAEAATKCKKRGTLPAHLERKLDKLLDTKINWQQYIYRFVVNELPYDFSLSKPSRRYITQGMYLPGTIKENLDLVAMVDLSGSVSDTELSEFVNLMAKITNQFRNVNITIVSHDTDVTGVTEIKQATAKKILNAKYEGGGGTSHRKVFKWVDDNKRNVPLVIAFTDGHTLFPKEKPKYPVLWVINKNGINVEDVPFGQAIKIEDT